MLVYVKEYHTKTAKKKKEEHKEHKKKKQQITYMKIIFICLQPSFTTSKVYLDPT